MLGPETGKLRRRGALARAELHAPIGDQVERGDAFSNARRVVLAWRHLDDAVAESNAPSARGSRAKHDFGRGGDRVLLQKVVLHEEHVVEAQAIRQLDLLEGLFDHLVLVVRVPLVSIEWPRQLHLVEEAELHTAS